jgi:hypothetical protein
MNTEPSSTLDFLRRGNKTITNEVIIEKPIYIEQECPPCPECEENKIVNVDTLRIKNEGDILVKPNKK